MLFQVVRNGQVSEYQSIRRATFPGEHPMGVVGLRQSLAHWFTLAHGSLLVETEGNVGLEDV